MIQNSLSRLFLVIIFASLITSGCKKKPEAVASKLYKHYENKAYLEFDTTAYNVTFKKELDTLKSRLHYPKTLSEFYEANELEPVFTNKYLFTGDLRTLVKYLQSAGEHGLDTSIFKATEISAELDAIHANHFKNVNEIYPVLSRLEIKTADALLHYAAILHFGVVDPHGLYPRYDMRPKRPDSAFYQSVLNAPDMPTYLHNIQPRNSVYLAMQKALASVNVNYMDSAKLARVNILKLNMERLRWQIPAKDDHYIFVNIPAFNLDWVEKEKTVLSMRVCVGQPKPADYDVRLKIFRKSGEIDDKPLNHETNILSSRITTVQLNPTWSIPASIAQTETYTNIIRYPGYLARSGIRVYKDEQEINADTVQWGKISREKMPYSFRQDASDDNALGKIKFIFDNEDGIYLHDTDNKRGFLKPWRAISHGCVRVQDPLMLTQQLIGDTTKMDAVRMEIGMEPVNPINRPKYDKIQTDRAEADFQLKSKYIRLTKSTQLFIDYYTCWTDDTGKITYYYDVYKLDKMLAGAMGKYLSKATSGIQPLSVRNGQ